MRLCLLFCSRTHAELATAVELIVETIEAEKGVTPFLKAALAPVAVVEMDKGSGVAFRGKAGLFFDLLSSPMTGFIDLVKSLPAAGSERGGKLADAQLTCFAGAAQETILETSQTAVAALGFCLETCYVLQPSCMVIVIINNGKSQLPCIAGNLILTNKIFLFWIDIGIAIEDDGFDIMLQHPLKDSTGTRGAAAMKKDFFQWG